MRGGAFTGGSQGEHALSIPATSSLAVVATGFLVRRESVVSGAVLTRVASSHLRVGSFQYAQAMDHDDLLCRFANHAIACPHAGTAEAETPYLAVLEAVVMAQASLVGQWMLVGFIHDVMNTDSMTTSGEPIDSGRTPSWTFSIRPRSTARSRQPAAMSTAPSPRGAWNLARLCAGSLPFV